jgi:hypothetical protein
MFLRKQKVLHAIHCTLANCMATRESKEGNKYSETVPNDLICFALVISH